MGKIVLFLLLLVGCVAALATGARADSSLNLIKAHGCVNKTEIGGEGLYVFSLWGRRADSSVSPDGEFKTVIADSRPQKLSVKDEKGRTRALAMVMPKDTGDIVFDARSTAEAILFQDASLFRTAEQVKIISQRMDHSSTFEQLVGLFKKDLTQASVEELTRTQQYTELLEKCYDEVFMTDTQAIKKSLSEAQDRLQKTLIGNN